MRRREFIKVIAGSAAAWPLAVRAQQGERVRRIGVLMGGHETDSEAQTWKKAFELRLAELGWTDGRRFRGYPRQAWRECYWFHQFRRHDVGQVAANPEGYCAQY